MKTNPITIATTNSDKHLNKLSKEFIFDICQQINNDPKPIYVNKDVVGMTSHAKVKVRNRLSVQMELLEPALMELGIKGKDCYFLPAFDDAISVNKNGFEIVQEGKIVGICMVKEHHDKSIKPTIFEHKRGVDYFIFNGNYLDEEKVEELKKAGKPTYVFYSDEYTELYMVTDARKKGMMKENLDQTIPPFTIRHGSSNETFESFAKTVESEVKQKWTTQSSTQ